MTEINSRLDRVARLLGDRYRVLEFLGEGGFAAVFQVVNPRLGRIEALKVLKADHSEEPDFARRFEQEARVAASLDHPGIVKIFDYGSVEDLFWFTMQFVSGPTLVRELKEKRRLGEGTSLRIAIAVLDALDYSHARGVIHRDVKPDNIILDSEGRPYLMDFGIAKTESSLVRTRTGTVFGSPAYVAPEQLSAAPIDGRADLFAFGVTLYRMLSNAFPFYDEDPFRMATKRLTMPPEPLSARLPEISPKLEAVVMRSLAREPKDRFSSAGEMRDALRSILEGKPSALHADRSGEAISAPRSASIGDVSSSVPSLVPSTEAVSRASMPTIRTTPPAQPPKASPASWRNGLAAALVVAMLAVAAAVLVTGRRSNISGTRQVGGSTAGATPTSAPPSPREVAAETPAAVATAIPATVASALPSPTRIERRAPPALRAAERPIPTPARRLGKKPVEEMQVPIEVSTEIAEKYGNQPVGLSALIGEDGSVKKVRVISPLCPECDRAAVEAVSKYRFQPALDTEGRPMEMAYTLTLIIPAK